MTTAEGARPRCSTPRVRSGALAASEGWFAIYESRTELANGEEKRLVTHTEIVCWWAAPAGTRVIGLVPDPRYGGMGLVNAETETGWKGYTKWPHGAPVVGLEPAHGWVVEFSDRRSIALDLWTLDADGKVSPGCVVEEDGEVYDPRRCDGFVRLRRAEGAEPLPPFLGGEVDDGQAAAAP